MAQHDDPAVARPTAFLEPGPDQPGPDALALVRRQHGHGPEAEAHGGPAPRLEPDRAEEDVPHDLGTPHGDEGARCLPVSAKRVHEVRLGRAAERPLVDLPDRRNVAGPLAAG